MTQKMVDAEAEAHVVKTRLEKRDALVEIESEGWNLAQQ